MDWETKRIKDIIQLKARIGWKGLRSDEFQTNSYAYLVTGQDFNSSEIIWAGCYQIDKERYEEDPYIQLKNGDVLVTKDGTIGKVAMVNNLDKPACLNSGVFVLKQKQKVFNQKYLFWELSSSIFRDFIKENSDGSTIQHLYQNVFDFMNVIIPPIEIQCKIANFLDAKTQNIDTKIKLLEKKKERYIILRKAIINEALNSNGKNWKTLRIKDIAESIIGLTYSPDDIVDESEGVLVLRSGNIQDGKTVFNDNVYVNAEIDKKLHLKKGDVLMCSRNGSASLIGKCSFIDKKYDNCTWGAFMTVIRSKYGKFLYWIFNSHILEDCKGMFQTSTVNQLTARVLDNISIPLPSLDEQQKISDYLDKKTSSIDSIIEKITTEINSLKTYRRALINEAVTGKLKIE